MINIYITKKAVYMRVRTRCVLQELYLGGGVMPTKMEKN